ncbi:MAG: hypothetical protein ACRYGR_05795 [Janthinobacterium lividum]
MTYFNKFFVGNILHSSERSWTETFKLFIFLFVGFVILDAQYLKPIMTPISNDSHGLSSLNKAYGKVFCGKEENFSSSFLLKKDDINTPINKIFGDLSSGKENICSGSQFYVLNEPSLSNLLSLIFKIFPSISLSELSIVLTIIKVFMLLSFSFLLLKVGMSPLYVLCFSTTSYFLIYCVDLTHRLFLYPFLIPNFLFLVSLSILYLYGLKRFGYKFVVFGFLIGLFGAYYSNFRTSHTPIIYYVLFLSSLFSYFVTNEIIRSKLKRFFLIPLTLITFVLAFQSSWYLNIKSIEEKQNDADNRIYHSVTHPLVLALGIDSSDLATREGIKWLDDVGENLAHKIDPSANYLSSKYEKALLTYYIKLWIFYPKEVYQIYKNKFTNFTTLFSVTNLLPHLKNNTSDFIIKSNLVGIKLIAFYSWGIYGIFLVSIMMLILFYRKISVIVMFLALSIIPSCFMLLMESILIVHYFVATYHILVNSLFLIIALYYFQLFINFCYKKIMKTTFKNEDGYAR